MWGTPSPMLGLVQGFDGLAPATLPPMWGQSVPKCRAVYPHNGAPLSSYQRERAPAGSITKCGQVRRRQKVQGHSG